MSSTRGGRSLVPGRGFTLLELLVAAGITTAIAVFIVVIVHNVSTTWTRTTGRLSADGQARIILDQLELDLQGAIFRDDGNVWMAADVVTSSNGTVGTPWQSAQRNAKPASISLDVAATRSDLASSERGKFQEARYGTAGAWLRFFTTSRGANATTNLTTVSSPVAVSYQIVRRFLASNPSNTNTGYALHRVEVRPTAVSGRPGTIESGYNIIGNAYTTSTGNNNGSQTGDPRTIQVVTTNTRNLDSIIADNVIDFGIRCYVRDMSKPGGLRLVFPALAVVGAGNLVTFSVGYSPKRAGTGNPTWLRAALPSNTPASFANFDTLYPDVIDVMLRVLTDEGAAQIANIEKNQAPPLQVPSKYQNNPQAWWWGVATENSRVYTRRFVLNAKPL